MSGIYIACGTCRYMSQPKIQLETFKAWAGLSSDISYYLNSHHIDFSEWTFGDRARPTRVTATAASGVAEKVLGHKCEDTITVNATWENPETKTIGIANYTSSWVAPKSDVHTQQRFFAMCQSGEISVDQAHRGYTVSSDAAGFASPNPLFMKYTPDEGRFVGQSSYGYRSFEVFVAACREINAGTKRPHDFDKSLATVHCTYQGTAILQAGRLSLDNDCVYCDK
jgi:D-galacturonate reductase